MDFEQWLTDLVEAAQLAPNTATFDHEPAVFICDRAMDWGSAGEGLDLLPMYRSCGKT